MTRSAQRLSASSEFSLRKNGPEAFGFKVLNAFRHHRNSHTVASGFTVTTVMVLNAFRHHRNSHGLSIPAIGTPFTLVLNAFRHHRNSHGLFCGPCWIKSCVLNAFRHHRNSHYPDGTKQIQGYSAQRLSASSEFSRRHGIAHWTRNPCSTPFGIIGILTVSILVIVVGADMCSTPFGIIGILT